MDMIAGIGVDMIKISRIARAYERRGFVQRIYTEKEQEIIGNNMSRAAGNFAAKEAVAKAFGTGFRRILPTQIEVLRDPAGKPFVNLYEEAKQQAEALKICNFAISISNEKEYAVAFVVAEKIS